jgi:ABC-type enterobactin transport system permease subunit
MMAATAISWALTIEAEDLPLCAIAAVMAIAAFISNRNLPIAVIALAAPLARHLPRAWQKMVPAKESARRPRSSGWINQAILVGLRS